MINLHERMLLARLRPNPRPLIISRTRIQLSHRGRLSANCEYERTFSFFSQYVNRSTALKIIQVLGQDKYFHNSPGYSKFKRSTEKRKKILYKLQNRKSIFGQKFLTIFMPCAPLHIRFRCACVLEHLMVLNSSHYTGYTN